MATTQSADPKAAEEFAGSMLRIVNDGMTTLMISVGHRTGLFDAMAGLEPATSTSVAHAAGLNERYVREWLKGMTIAGIVDHDAAADTYVLPPERSACLTRAAGPENLASFAQYASLFGDVEGDVVRCFREGGGVPYSAYPRFQELQAEESGAIMDLILLDAVIPMVAGMPERLEAGADVWEIGSGRGHALNLMAERYPASRFTGLDFSEEGIAAATAEAEAKGLRNITFRCEDALLALPDAGADLVCAFDVIHDLADPAAMLRGIRGTLRPDGVFLMVDIAGSSDVEHNRDHPLGPALYTASLFHCMTVSLAQGGAGLGTMWGEELARDMLAEAGFGDVQVERLEGDILNLYYVCRPGS